MPDRSTPSILRKILADSRADVERRQASVPFIEVVNRAKDTPAPRDFHAALIQNGLSLIAEFKRASPSKGDIFPDATPEDVARGYVSGGAKAMSVLTNAPYFKGSDDNLKQVRAAVDVPILRKDFTVSPYQIHEARLIGADAILLIVAALEKSELADMIGVAEEIGLAALVETHTEDEVAAAVDIGARIIGINNRDLNTFNTTLETTERLIGHVPDDRTIVSESGIFTSDDARRLRNAGADAILVGESLMRAAGSGTSIDTDALAGEVCKLIDA